MGESHSIPFLSSSPSLAPKSIGYNNDFYLFWNVWSRLKEKYVDQAKLVPEQMYQGAIKGMVSSLGDPFTFYLTEKENKESKDDLGGKFEGIGAQLGQRNGAIVVVAPLKSSPAEKAGIKNGDIIYKVNDEKTNDWTITKTVSKIRGPKGTKVKLSIYRKTKELDFEIIRDQIKVNSVEVEYIDSVAVLHLSKFGDETGSEWDKAIAEISSKYSKNEVKGMILDVRDNPGGYLQGAVYIASEFLPTGTLIVKQVSTKSEEKYLSERKPRLGNIPLIALINEGSASASEIVTGALRDHSRAKLLGAKSYGKGSVQEALDLEGGAGLHVTIAKWILPNGDWIHEKGIEPNYKVVQNDLTESEMNDTTKKPYDLQKQTAIDLLLNRPTPTSVVSPTISPNVSP